MTTITVKNEIKGLTQTEFGWVEELFQALEEIAPLKFYQADKQEFSKETLDIISASKSNPNRKLTNFQG